VPPGAQWCGLCFADLRPDAGRAADPARQHGAGVDPLTAPLETLPMLAVRAPEPAEAAPGSRAEDMAPAGRVATAASWPCLRCRGTNAVDDDACRHCGAAFLAGVESAELLIPGLGRAKAIDKPHKVALVVGGSVVLTLLLVGISIVIGALV
jgi:hypothetical protein